MTKKEEQLLRRAEKEAAERERTEQMKVPERSVPGKRICGVDEAGRGPFAGPVFAGAVILDLDDPEKEILYLNDSKKLSEKKRELLYREILKKAVAVGIGYAGAKTIDRINILQATYLAMQRAVAHLQCVSALTEETEDIHTLVHRLIRRELPQALEKDPENPELSAAGDQAEESCRVVPDFVLADAVHIPRLAIPQQGIVKGDAKSISIAAASIVAKVTRDHVMYEYDRRYPVYGFASHKGYGTKAHIAAIREYGLTEIHRRSFIHL